MSPDVTSPDSLGAPPWMTAAPARAVMAALEARGGAGCARFVGGCVRNTLMGAPVDDVDIATTLTPDQTTEALEAAGLRAVPTGVDHGTVTAVASGAPFEITTLRRDVTTDGRRAVVAFTQDWAEDAQRRDFRFNAIYADGEGKLFDPTGAGVADALAGRVTFVGEARQRILEDHLRILRYFRFLAWYGGGDLDREAVAACADLAPSMAGLPAERISKELLKLLAAPDPRASVRLMAKTGVLAVVLPQAAGIDRFAALVALEGDHDAELRLAALLPDDPAVAAEAAARLKLSNALRERLAAAAGAGLDAAMSGKEARKALYALGAPTFADRAKLAWAADGDGRWRALLALAEGWTRPAFPLGGDDAAAAGIARGPAIGRALREAEAWWIDHDFAPGREALLARLRGAAAN